MMKKRSFIAVIAAAAALALPASGAFAQRRPVRAARVDWTRIVVRTPEGGVRMGNPAAPLKLIEYGSITCPHCAELSAEGGPILRDRYVRSGRLSWEYRPYLIFPTDPGVFMLLNCLAPGQFFPAAEQLYASQRAWVGRVQAIPPDQVARLSALPAVQRAAALVRAAGLDLFFRQHGLAPARINACLNDRAGLVRVGEITRHADQIGVQGTPTFLINGRLVGALDWARLEPMLAGR